ncbi:hypothetical protein quinque_005992 [Culex quinquefasciatus]
MKPRLAGGLALVLALSICLQSISRGTCAASDGDDDDDDYHYDYDDTYGEYEDDKPADSDKLSSSSTTAPTSTTIAAGTTSSTTAGVPQWGSDEDDASASYPCPRGCSCEDGTRFLNCSQRSLTEVPADLPRNVIRLDLSWNNIKRIPVEAFQNITEVRDLWLDRNVIEELDKEVFIGLTRLDVLGLSGNLLEHLAVDSFVEAHSLRRLVLSENPLVVPDEGPFLQLPELEELELANCNLTEVTHESFGGLEGLKSLNLAGNMFDEELSTEVFEPLVNLQRLHMPPLSEDTVRELCDVVKSIDVVDITTHNVSCFYLASETSYEESIITQRPSTTETPKPKVVPVAPSSTTTTKPTRKLVKTENEIEEEVKTTAAPQLTASTRRSTTPSTTTTTTAAPTVSGPSSASITHSVDADPAVTKQVESPGEQSLLASISSETMKQLLLGICAAGVGILLVGIICRRTGLKNKFCGSKRRPAPTDQVRPAEEVPLNKV